MSSTTVDLAANELADLRSKVRVLGERLRHTQRLATVGTCAAMVAHEFNNILTPVLSYAELAKGGDEEFRTKAIRHARDGANRAIAICRAILDISGRDTPDASKVVLAQVVDETLAAMGREPAKDGIRLIKRIPARLSLTTRPVELKQVLLNLILNARSAVMSKGRGLSIDISAQRADSQVLIRVADTGVGIPPENLDQIFQPFFTTRNGHGTGLGLAICHRIITSLDGQLTVRSQVGKGTCFTIALPDNAA